MSKILIVDDDESIRKAIAYKLKKNNYEVFSASNGIEALIKIREINPDLLMDFPNIDAYINTACPRISLDTPRKFQKPILTVNEFMVVCGEYSWENLIKEGLFVS
ncbi:MAG TPA: diphthamide synthesis protein [Candidatus Eremiobacteraeota bacterium]|nr:diphthamide synthesis protein [Candidatus Eremiobacteraeota bacterium]